MREGEDQMRSGAPEAGGATSRGSSFGGWTSRARWLRAAARIARAVEAGAYRRLRDMDRTAPERTGYGGRPHRVREASHLVPRHPEHRPA